MYVQIERFITHASTIFERHTVKSFDHVCAKQGLASINLLRKHYLWYIPLWCDITSQTLCLDMSHTERSKDNEFLNDLCFGDTMIILFSH